MKDNETIYKDDIDRKSWLSLLEKSRHLQQKGHGYFLGDIHTTLLKTTPQVKPISEIAASRIPARTIIEEMLKTSDYHRLHSITAGDPVGSAMGTLSLAEELIKTLRKFGDIDSLAGMERQMQSLQALIDTLQEVHYNTDKPQKQARELDRKIEKAACRLRQQADVIRLIVRKSCRKAQEEVQHMQESLAAWGSDPGKPVSMDVHASLQIAHQLMSDPKLRKISALAGRMRAVALSKRETKANRAAEEMIDIEFGNELARTLPGELVLLYSPLRLDFLKRFTEKTLQQYKMEGREKQGKGPVIVCMDESASMAGDKEIWAKGYFLGFHALAAKDRRDIAYLTFGTEVTRSKLFPQASVDPVELCELLAYFGGHGGTAFDPPLSKALTIIDKSMPKADIVFISDGISHISPDVKERIEKARRAGLHLYVVLIGTGTSQAFDSLADLIVHVEEAAKVYELV